MVTDKTSTLLIAHLKSKLASVDNLQQRTLILEIIANARSLAYDDFNSDFAMPKSVLIQHLQIAGLQDLAQNVAQGEYD